MQKKLMVYPMAGMLHILKNKKGFTMIKLLASIIFLLVGGGNAWSLPSDIIRQQLPQSVPHYYKWGPLWVKLQVHYFKPLFLIIIISVLLIFFLHYIIIGPKSFDEEKKIKYYNLFNRIVHWLAALSFILLVPTGLIIVFGKFFGGGSFVRSMRILHDIGAAIFLIVILPLFLMWLKDMLPHPKDIKWFLIGGGYLTRGKVETEAGKFNPGQKIWFWIAVGLGAVMILSGSAMYFQQFYIGIFDYQIDLLRVAAIVHNFSAMIIVAMFIVHLYMSLFAIKGSLHSMISGYKSEEEVRFYHSRFYKKLMQKRNTP